MNLDALIVAGLVIAGYLFATGRLAAVLQVLREPVGEVPDAADEDASATQPPMGTSDAGALGTPLAQLRAFALRWGLTITSETEGRHNPGSLHYQGRAIDVSARGLTDEAVRAIDRSAAAEGIRLRDERRRPPGQAVWGGPHLHLELRG